MHKGIEIMIIKSDNAIEVCEISNTSENKNLILK